MTGWWTVTLEHDGPSPRGSFRVLTRQRPGSQGSEVADVQLPVHRTGGLVRAQTFSDPVQARELEQRIAHDLDTLDDEAFRRAHLVPSDA
jgi:hypothetical protein